MRKALELDADPNTMGSINMGSHIMGLNIMVDFEPHQVLEQAAEGARYDDFLLSYGRPLHFAAKRGHDDMVNLLLDYGADLNVPSRGVCDCDESWPLDDVLSPYYCPLWFPLHHALCHGHVSTANILLDRHAPSQMRYESIDHPGKFTPGPSVLHSAAAAGLESIIQRVLETDPTLIHKNNKRASALHYVSQCWSSEGIIERLLSAGADLEAKDHQGLTPIFRACQVGNFATAMHLLKAGAKTRPPRPPGWTEHVKPLLHYAVGGRTGFWDKRIPTPRKEREREQMDLIRALVEECGHHVDEPMRSWPGFAGMTGGDVVTPLNSALDPGKYYWNGSITEIVEYLLQAGANPNHPGVYKSPPITMAISRLISHYTGRQYNRVAEYWSVVSTLVGFAARLDLADSRGTSPLTLAAFEAVDNGPNGYAYSILEFLLKNALPGALPDEHLCHVMLCCVLRGSRNLMGREVVYLLLADHGASLNYQDPDISRKLEDGYLGHDDTWLAALCLKNDCLFSSLGTVLLQAIRRRSYGVAALLIEEAPRECVDVFDPINGLTALHYASSHRNQDLVTRLLDAGADVNAIDQRYRSPLFLAVHRPQADRSELDLVNVLLRHGADPFRIYPNSLGDETGLSGNECFWNPDLGEFKPLYVRSPFAAAIARNSPDLLKLMLQFGRPPRSLPLTSCDYIHWSIYKGAWNALEVLLESGANPNGAYGCRHPPIIQVLCMPAHWSRPRSLSQPLRLLFKYRVVLDQPHVDLETVRDSLDDEDTV
ncbi:ankyrin repeat-containing domain protein [Xylariaceae sp. FL0662B]|nr:ankyrin repeat-containing domain protein [Xylariaceae sp. FL0662B]